MTMMMVVVVVVDDSEQRICRSVGVRLCGVLRALSLSLSLSVTMLTFFPLGYLQQQAKVGSCSFFTSLLIKRCDG